MNRHVLLTAALLTAAVSMPATAVDAAAADKLVRKSKCLTCHSVDRKKDGPSFKETAAKYKGKPDAVAEVTRMATKPSKVKVEGREEDHQTLKTTDDAEVSNVVQWILSL
jgi:cytochrome c